MRGFEVKYAGCCAVAELCNISRINDPEEIVRQTVGYIMFKPYVYFTGVVAERAKKFDVHYHADTDENYGQKLADYIKAEDLGEIFDELPVKQNWSGNMVKVWFWFPDYKALVDIWLKNHPPAVLNIDAIITEEPTVAASADAE